MDDLSFVSTASSPEARQPNLFTILDDTAQARFRGLCSSLSFSSGQALFLQGFEHDCSYIIEDGLVRTYYVSPSGREITLGYWSSGDLVGGPTFLGGGVHVWSGVAARPTKAFAISGPALRKFVASDTAVSEWIIDVMAFKLRWLSILFQIHGTDCVEDRLTKLLVQLAENYGEKTEAGIVIRYKISQGDLGSLIGASRQWTNKTMAKLRDDDLLTLKDRLIVLKDIDVLRRRGQAGANHHG